MLYEYALEPSLLTNWANVRFYLGKFGVENGRLISRYPKCWARLVREGLASCPDYEKKRIIEALSQVKVRLLSRHHEWDEAQPWLENAEQENAKRPFHAIIASSNPRSLPCVLLDDDIDDTRRAPLWQAPRSQVIQRQPATIALAVRNLLRCSQTVLFVDGNFDPKISRFRLPLEECLLVLLDERTRRPTARVVQYHVGVEAHAVPGFTSLSQAYLPAHVPSGMSIEFVLWRPADLHNRYVLTDRGAIQFGEGLDQAGPTGRPDDVVTLLEQTVAEQLLQGFTGSPPRYTLVGRLSISGTRVV
jgi:hypothetical protein